MADGPAPLSKKHWEERDTPRGTAADPVRGLPLADRKVHYAAAGFPVDDAEGEFDFRAVIDSV